MTHTGFRRGLVLSLGSVIVVATLAWINYSRQRSDDQTMTEQATVPHPPKRPLEQMDDPKSDGWPTEVLSSQAKKQLHHLGDMILHPEQISTPALGKIATPNVAFHELVPAKTDVAYADEVLQVERGTSPPTAVHGIEKLKAALRHSASSFAAASDVRIKIKVVRIHHEAPSFVTRQLVAISGITKTGVIEQHATWRTHWVTGREGSPPRLTQLEVVDFEQITSRTGGHTLFSDCTQSALGKNRSFNEQIGRGLNHWLRRTQNTQYFFGLGNPGLALGDVNGDGLDDLYLCQEEGLPNLLFIQNADGTLRDQSEVAGVNWIEGSRSALLVDLDNDGDQDLAVAMMGGVMLAANRGDGHFEYRTLLPTSHDLMSLSAADYDEDGRLDLYACVYWQNASESKDGPRSSGLVAENFVYHDSNSGGANSLFRNETTQPQSWSFRDVTTEVGLDVNNQRWSFAAAWEDYDNDGDQDLYVANDFGRNNLFQNEDGKFVDVAAAAGVEDIASGMAVSWGDVDRDGLMDVYVSNMFSAAGNRITFQQEFKPDALEVKKRLQRFARGNTLQRNLDDGSFGDVSQEAAVTMGRWAWGNCFVDINNDGWLDLAVANGNITGEDSGDL